MAVFSGVCVLVVCVLQLPSGHCTEDRRGLVDMQEVLDQFLHVLNATDEGPRSGPADPPEYMMELYKRFSSTAPSGQTVRSFRNTDQTSERVTRGSVRMHRLLFNISVPRHETVVNAELRLHMRVRTDSRPRPASGWKVSVFDVHQDGCYRTGDRDLLATKHTHRKDSGWEVFDLTNAVHHWLKVNTVTPRLEVQIENLNAFRNMIWEHVDLDVDGNPDGKHEPALVIFSNSPTENEDEEWSSGGQDQDSISEDGSRVRRSAKLEDCQMAEMYVNFKDIGWDFILAPTGYQAFTCRGACNYPLVPEVTPTKHAVVRALLNLASPARASHPCCVPTALKPISILYVDKNGIVVLTNYEGMVVKECGCR